ncbi:2OG-Fe(II) oxygenase [Streptomyces sp. NPDC004539]|uniref:2OG-Fe(II) oxygenase n=1 Tax=Streptomyces sp. NPDC004539 TaxID=3154280 RepID=UPI0033A5B991
MIDLDTRLETHEHPFRHFRGAALLSARALADLGATAPDEGLFKRIDTSTTTGYVRRRYRSSVLPLSDNKSGFAFGLDALAPPWRELATDLVSGELADWLRRETGVDTAGLHRTSEIFRHYDGDFDDLNTGKLHKRLQLSLHLNEDWPGDGGGEFELWSGPDRSAGPAWAMSPVGGTALIYSASPSSWHQTVPVSEGRGLVRLSVSLSFFE